jgi:hypothetical protein
MVVGKYLSRSPGRLVPNMVVFILIYSIVAPLWLMYSISDVVRGVHTTWR